MPKNLILIGKVAEPALNGYQEVAIENGLTDANKIVLSLLDDIPSGKFLGRTTAESGQIELLDINNIGSIGIAKNSLSLDRLSQIAPGTVIGNVGINTADPVEVTIPNLVDGIPEDTVQLNRLKYIPTGKVLGRISPGDGQIEVIDPIGTPGGAGVTIVSVAHFIGIENRDGMIEREKIDVGLPYTSKDLFGSTYELTITWDAGDPLEPDPPFITIQNYSSNPLDPERLEIVKRDHLGRAFYTPDELQEFISQTTTSNEFFTGGLIPAHLRSVILRPSGSDSSYRMSSVGTGERQVGLNSVTLVYNMGSSIGHILNSESSLQTSLRPNEWVLLQAMSNNTFLVVNPRVNRENPTAPIFVQTGTQVRIDFMTGNNKRRMIDLYNQTVATTNLMIDLRNAEEADAYVIRIFQTNAGNVLFSMPGVIVRGGASRALTANTLTTFSMTRMNGILAIHQSDSISLA